MKAAAALDRARRMRQRSSMANDSPPEDEKDEIPPIAAEDSVPPNGADADDGPMDEGDEEKDGPLTTGDYHHIAQKQILNAVFAVLAETKMDWGLVAPFLEAAREVCLGDIEETAQIRLHTLRAEGTDWIEAEEAFVGISVSDRDDGKEWLPRPTGFRTSPPTRILKRRAIIRGSTKHCPDQRLARRRGPAPPREESRKS